MAFVIPPLGFLKLFVFSHAPRLPRLHLNVRKRFLDDLLNIGADKIRFHPAGVDQHIGGQFVQVVDSLDNAADDFLLGFVAFQVSFQQGSEPADAA